MPHTESIDELAVAIHTKLYNHRFILGLKDVYYGRHEMVPVSPIVIVMPGIHRSPLVGVQGPGGRVDNELNVVIDVLSSEVPVETSEGELFLSVGELARRVEKTLYKNIDTGQPDFTMGGLLIHGYVTDRDPGEIFIGASVFRTRRLTYTGRTRTMLSAT